MFNQNKTIGVIRASSPESLTKTISRISGPMQILGFGNDTNGAFAYYRTTDGMHKRVLNEIDKASSFGGENNEQGDDLKTV
jgi:hypothetical protein